MKTLMAADYVDNGTRGSRKRLDGQQKNLRKYRCDRHSAIVWCWQTALTVARNDLCQIRNKSLVHVTRMVPGSTGNTSAYNRIPDCFSIAAY